MYLKIFFVVLLFMNQHAHSQSNTPLEIYSQDYLNKLVYNNKHLQKIKADDCQLVQDIKAHAIKANEPSFAFVWGDMLSWGVCVDRNPKLGLFYIKKSAKEGLLPALEQLGRYHERGIFVVKNPGKAIIYYREAALQGFVNAQMNYIRMLLQGYGSPLDYEGAYHVLFNSVINDKKKHQEAERLLNKLAKKMPKYAVERAKYIKMF
ncbi:MAG: sel1 repeat family protein [Psychromonas sp.]|nr:sel1 repeat family protein [Psychromonas sp.]